MAKLTDPDSYEIAVNATATTEEVEIQTGTLTVELRVAGNLDDTAPGKTSGGTAKSAYSFLKEEWLTNAILRRFKFPIKMIFEGSFIWVNGWAPANAQTRDLFRDAGFEEQVSGNINACMISLGNIDAPLSDLGYYTNDAGFTATTTDFDKTGELNENVDITGVTSYFKAYLREQGKLYGEYSLLAEQGLSIIGFQAYAFPLTNSNDSKVTTSDGNIDTLTPYTNMEINYIKGQLFESAAEQAYLLGDVIQDAAGRWAYCSVAGTLDAAGVTAYAGNGGTGTFVAYFGEELIGSTYYAFNREVDAGTGTDVQAHEFLMRQLRQVGDINNDTGITAGQDAYGTVNGEVARLLDIYVGDTMVLEPGVVIRNFDANSTNSIKHQPITVDTNGLDSDGVPLVSTEVSFPFVAAGNFIFSSNFVSQPDVDTIYTVYFDYTKLRSAATIGVTAISGSQGTIADSGSAMAIGIGEYFTLAGFTDTDLNGLWLEDGGSPTAASVTATKQNGATVSTEAAGNTVTIKVNPYESPGAIIVQNNASTNLDAQITAGTIAWDFDYTNNNQGGRTPASPAPCTIVAIAKDGAEWIDATFTITAATGINIPVNGGDERNYANPA
jgi:hypothetical protein